MKLRRNKNRPVAIVTGGAGGIGRAMVQRLAAEHRVVVVDLREEAARDALGEGDGLALTIDVTDPDANVQMMETVMSEYGRVDVVCLNAGRTTGLYEMDQIRVGTYRNVVALNQDAVFFGVRAAIPALRATGGGSILVTSSLGGLIGIESDPIYSMTKHAVIGLVRSLPTLLAPYNIRVHALCPGFADTPLIGEYADVFRSSGYPLLEPEDVAVGAMAALASQDSGDAWVVQPGREPLPYKFAGVPGPRIEGYRGGGPPTLLA